MVFLNFWALFALLPLWLVFRRHTKTSNSKQIYLLYASLFLIVIALARPALKNSPAKESFDSQDFIIAIDASYSMMADDIKPNRFEAAKKAIKKLLKLHPKDRFTIFAFTSNALLISPPTTDTAIAISALDTLNPKYILTKSTSLENLFLTVAKLSQKEKKLIVFSDGGEDTDVAKLVGILKNNHITPYFVATATQKGAPLKKEGKYLKNSEGVLVISRINPALKDIASLSGGSYFKLDSSLDTIDDLSSEITNDTIRKKTTLEVTGYKELYALPLIIATILFFIATTKIHQIIFPLLLIVLPYKSEAGVLDFYYLNKADKALKAKNYENAIRYYAKVTPSVQSYYNIANLYYRLGKYREALRVYSFIKTPDPKLKAHIYYNMGNCAAKMKKYDIAKRYYRYTLALLPNDKDALENLHTLQRLHLHDEKLKRPTLKQRKDKKRKTHKNPEQHDQNNKNKKGSSNRSSSQSSNGGGDSKKQKQRQGSVKKTQNNNNNFRLGYKAYELINKGYANEKEPW